MMPWAPHLSAIKWVIGLALLTSWTWVVYDYAGNKADIAIAEAEADAAAARADLAEERAEFTAYARQAEHDKAEELSAIAYQAEQDKADAIAAKDRVIADLRADRLQLRDHWTCPAVPGPAAGSGQPDAGTALRRASAGAVVQAVAECQAQVRGLQAVIRADRGRSQ